MEGDWKGGEGTRLAAVVSSRCRRSLAWSLASFGGLVSRIERKVFAKVSSAVIFCLLARLLAWLLGCLVAWLLSCLLWMGDETRFGRRGGGRELDGLFGCTVLCGFHPRGVCG